MNELKLFTNQEFGELDVLLIDGREYFPATACAKILEYSNPNDAIIRHCRGVVKREGVSQTTNQHGATTGQTVTTNYIPEGDLFRLIVRSKLPSAERFERWVFDEVLPSIRRVGVYATEETAEKLLADPDALIEALRELKAKRLPLVVRQERTRVLEAASI